MLLVCSRIEVVQDQIATVETDAIVTFTAEALDAAAGSVDREIHRAAGPELERECRRLLGCSAGKAKISKGYDLPARHVIHTVAPGDSPAAELAACYRSSLELAAKHELHSIAFPAREDTDRDVVLALTEVSRFLESHAGFERVIVCCSDQESFESYRRVLDSLPQ